VILLDPVWLFLLVPLLAAWRLWGQPTYLLRGLRLLMIVLLVLALAGAAVRLPGRVGTLVVVADRSLSMPPGSEVTQKGAIDLVREGMSAADRLGVVAFGRTAAVEHAPLPKGTFPGFTHEVGPDASNLADALDRALEIIPHGAPGRILLLSDGRWTGRAPATAAARAAARGVAIDYRLLDRPVAGDLAIARIDAPASTAAGESFLITAWVQAPTAQTASYELKRGLIVLAAGQRPFTAGLNRLTFRDHAAEAGSQPYSLTVSGTDNDPVPENNRARFLVGVQGPRPLLHVTTAADSGLARLLRAGGLNIEAKAPGACEWSLEALSRYAAVVLENVPAETIGGSGMETLAAWVRETGAGLLMTGGKNAYGPGGYYQSPLEPVLPVSMELRNEHRKLALAMVVALDRSGSMAVPVGGGRTKMDLANLGTVQVLDLLGPMDELGVLAVDTVPHVIAPLAHVTDKASIRRDILRIESMGGGIYVYEALAAAAKMLTKAKAGTRHIILFADAADAEEPGNYKELVEKCVKAGMTISVIGLGKPTDSDGPLLKDIAARGKGRVFFTDKPEELPRLFAQDTFVVARNTFLEDPTPVQATAGLAALTGRDFTMSQPLGGYNLCYLRPEATLGAWTLDEYKAPVVAAWQAGSGRVLCYTGEADGRFAGAMARWAQVGDYFTSLARWVAGPQGGLKDGMLLTQEVARGVHRVTLHLDPERTGDPFTGLPKVSLLRSLPGGSPEAEKTTLQWTGPDTLTLELPLRGPETALATVEVSGQPAQSLPPVCLPYSPEYEPAAGTGLAALEHLARATAGQERVELAGLWRDLPPLVRTVALAPWLALAAAILLLTEVLERRTGWLARLGGNLRLPLRRLAMTKKSPTRPTAKPRPVLKSALPIPEASPPIARAAPGESPVEEPAKGAGMLDALRQARRKTREETE
jgi:hypothetical protein